MSKFATMAGLITDFDRNPSDRHRRLQALDKPRSPSGSRFYATLSRSRTVTISSISNRSAPRSKPPARPIADSVRRRNPNPQPEKSEGVGSRATKRSKLRSIFSVVFPVHRRRRLPSISSQSAADSSSSSGMRKGDSNSSLSMSSSSSSSRSSIGGKIDGRKRRKRQNGYGCGGSSGIIVNLANGKGEKISRGNSLRRNGMQVVRRKDDEKEEEVETFELCKKKILMGMRCKPLNSSGKLRYDEEGILIPEPLPP